MRSDSLFDYSFMVDPKIQLSEILLPPLVLQPYVENAIWHGLMPKEDGNGILSIRVEQRSVDDISILISDNGIGRIAAGEKQNTLDKKSMGMEISKQRMELSAATSSSQFSVNIKDLVMASGKPGGTEVEIIISLKNDL